MGWGVERKHRLRKLRGDKDFPGLGEGSGVPWVLGVTEAFLVVRAVEGPSASLGPERLPQEEEAQEKLE